MRSRDYPKTKGLALSATFAVLLSVLSLVSVPIPFVPIPITLQVLGVLMIASLLGPYLGALACMVYLFLGFVNLPVFAGFTYGIPVLLGPNGGFLFSFPIAAFVGGTILRTVATDRKREILHVAMGFVASLVVIYVIGTYWLLVLFPPYFGAFLPLLPVFVAVDCLKAIVGAPIIIRLRSTRIDLPVNRSLRLVKTAQANHVPSDP